MMNLLQNRKIIFSIGISIVLMIFYVADIYWIDFFFKKESALMFFVLVFVSSVLMISVFWAESGNDIFIRESFANSNYFRNFVFI